MGAAQGKVQFMGFDPHTLQTLQTIWWQKKNHVCNYYFPLSESNLTIKYLSIPLSPIALHTKANFPNLYYCCCKCCEGWICQMLYGLWELENAWQN
jgi:hypothetical protein